MGRFTEKTQRDIFIAPSYQPIQPNPNHLVRIHARALQQLLLLTHLFNTSEVGSYLLTTHEPIGKTPPPIDTVFVYYGQKLSRSLVHKGNDSYDINKAEISQTGQRIIGRHHSHFDMTTWESGKDLDLNELHLASAAWTIRKTTPLSRILLPVAYNAVCGALARSGQTLNLDQTQICEEMRGLISIVTNLQGHILTQLHLAKTIPMMQIYNPTTATLQPFLYKKEAPPNLEDTLEALLEDLAQKKDSFALKSPPPYAFQEKARPKEILGLIERQSPLTSYTISLRLSRGPTEQTPPFDERGTNPDPTDFPYELDPGTPTPNVAGTPHEPLTEIPANLPHNERIGLYRARLGTLAQETCTIEKLLARELHYTFTELERLAQEDIIIIKAIRHDTGRLNNQPLSHYLELGQHIGRLSDRYSSFQTLAHNAQGIGQVTHAFQCQIRRKIRRDLKNIQRLKDVFLESPEEQKREKAFAQLQAYTQEYSSPDIPYANRLYSEVCQLLATLPFYIPPQTNLR